MVCGHCKLLNIHGRTEITRSFKAWVAGSNPAALTRFIAVSFVLWLRSEMLSMIL